MWRAGLAALLSHWRRHPGQAATLILGLALATALWTGVQAINAEARARYARAADLVSQNGAPVLSGADGRVTLAEYVALRRAGGGTRVSVSFMAARGVQALAAPIFFEREESRT